MTQIWQYLRYLIFSISVSDIFYDDLIFAAGFFTFSNLLEIDRVSFISLTVAFLLLFILFLQSKAVLVDLEAVLVVEVKLLFSHQQAAEEDQGGLQEEHQVWLR